MGQDFWAKRWADGRIGFHEGRPNRFLTDHAAQLGPPGRILVPLCGKAEDLAYLAELGHDVVGIELVEDAVRAFFAEHALTPAVSAHPEQRIRSYAAGRITVFVGDFFDATPELVGRTTALYDRAALVALPPELRPRYVRHVRTLLPPRAPGLVITIEYGPGLEPPPFAVREDEIRRLFHGQTVELLSEAPATSRREAEGGAVEKCYGLLA